MISMGMKLLLMEVCGPLLNSVMIFRLHFQLAPDWDCFSEEPVCR